MTEQQKKSIQENILTAIETGRVKMRPRWYFVVRTTLLIVGVILSVLALLYLASLIMFVLHRTGVWFAPAFGPRGLREFLFDVPWVLVLLVTIFIILVQLLVNRFAFSHARPLMYWALGIIVLVLVGGFIINQTSVHQGLFRQAQNDRLPFGNDFYRKFGSRPPTSNIINGQITNLQPDGFIILTPSQEILQIILSPKTRFPIGNDLEIGDRVVVAGDRNGNIIMAFGVREVTNDPMFWPEILEGPPIKIQLEKISP
jgi:hypothetical protein